jgi:hypothetical protein
MLIWSNWPPEFTLPTTPHFSQDFPSLRPQDCEDDVSLATKAYNCHAWAAFDTNRRWEPDPLGIWYWPDGVPRQYTLQAFIAAYRTVGYEQCLNGTNEDGIEKIAIYTIGGIPTHTARQLATGNWTSKLGDFEDIQHNSLNCLGGPLYGAAQTFMKRLRRK